MGLGAPNGESMSKATTMASACSVSPSSPYYMAQHLKGHESIEDRYGEPEPALCVWRGWVPFPGVSNLHATGMAWCLVPA